MALCPSDGVAARGFVNGRGPQPREALAHGRDRTEGPYRSEGHRACRIVQSAPYPILSALLRFLDFARNDRGVRSFAMLRMTKEMPDQVGHDEKSYIFVTSNRS